MGFLRNAWYCAGWSHEIDVKPKGIRMLNEYLVIYRGKSGTPFAMSGRCPHRFAPLDQGIVIDDNIMCPYHGLQFGSAGKCVHNPHGEGIIPPNAHVERTYAIVEQDKTLWVWMGDPGSADESTLPPITELSSEKYSSAQVYLNPPANYLLVLDNLLDLAHVPFLHQGTLAANEGEEKPLNEVILPRNTFEKNGDVITSNYYIDVMPPSEQLSTTFTDPLGKFEVNIHWRPASVFLLDLFMRPLEGGKAKPVHMHVNHFLTPETEHTTHYFASVSRDTNIDDKEEDKLMEERVLKAFVGEDEPMVVACGELMAGETDLLGMNPVILSTDAAGVQTRRLLARKIAAEEAQQHG